MKKLSTILMLAVLAAAGIATMTSCEKDNSGSKKQTNFVRFNTHKFEIPEDPGIYENLDGSLGITFDFEPEDGTKVWLIFYLASDKLGTTFTMAEGDTSWASSVDFKFTEGDDLSMSGHNDEMRDIRKGTMLIKDNGDGKFRIIVKATGTNGDTFELNFTGTLAPGTMP